MTRVLLLISICMKSILKSKDFLVVARSCRILSDISETCLEFLSRLSHQEISNDDLRVAFIPKQGVIFMDLQSITSMLYRGCVTRIFTLVRKNKESVCDVLQESLRKSSMKQQI